MANVDDNAPRKSLVNEICQTAPMMILLWILIGSFAGGVTSAVQPFFMQRSWAADVAGRPFEDVACPQELPPANVSTVCKRGLAQAASMDGYTGSIGSVLSFFIMPWTGAFADRVGPKTLLVASTVLSLPPAVMIWVAVHNPGNMFWLWAYYVCSTICVTWFLPIVLSTFAGICSPQNRAAAFSIVLATFEVSLMAGPKIGSVIQDNFGVESTYTFAVLLTGVQLLLACFLPQSLSIPRYHSGEALPTSAAGDRVDYYALNNAAETNLSAVGKTHDRACCRNVSTDFRKAMSILNRSPFFRVLAGMAFLQAAVGSGVEILFMYGLNAGFGFGQDDLGNFLLVVFATSAVTQLLLVQPLLGCLGTRGLLAFALVCAILNDSLNGLIMILFQAGTISSAISKLAVYIIAGTLSNGTFFVFPAIAALKANNVDDEEQGATQGALFSVKSIAGFIAPNIFTGLLQIYTSQVQILFFFSAFLSLLVAILMYRLPKGDKEN